MILKIKVFEQSKNIGFYSQKGIYEKTSEFCLIYIYIHICNLRTVSHHEEVSVALTVSWLYVYDI